MEHLWSPWRMEYINSDKNHATCVFCHATASADDRQNLVIYRGKFSFVILNRYPYTSGHLMVVPYQHQPSLELLDGGTRAEMMELASRSIQVLQTVYHPQGFNLGINIGAAGGAGILEHVHFHIVPRWVGDTNFMSAVADTRVLPEALEDSFQRILETWEAHPF